MRQTVMRKKTQAVLMFLLVLGFSASLRAQSTSPVQHYYDDAGRLATVTLGSGAASATGDLFAQLLNGAGTRCKPFNLWNAGAAFAGGAIGGFAGGYVGALDAAAGGAELESTVVNNLISSNIGTPVTGITGALLPKPTSGRKDGCQ